MKKQLALFFLALILAAGLIAAFTHQKEAKTSVAVSMSDGVFTIASYNVENFFDLKADGTEYPEYIPNFKGWDKNAYEIKLANVSKVLSDMDAAVVGLLEIENDNVLSALQQRLKQQGKNYPYRAVTHNGKSAVQAALLSKFPITDVKEFEVPHKIRERPILKVTLDVNGSKLVVFVNHWKAKTGPESQRIGYAKVLRGLLDDLGENADVVVLGDLNCNYDEMLTMLNDEKLNDTGGVSGLNHILATGTSKPGVAPKLANLADVAAQKGSKLIFDPWQELPKARRMSEFYRRQNLTPDHILITKGLLDKEGIGYIEGSFDTFHPDYLFDRGIPFRWQMTKGSQPKGFSDHLPLIAKFKIGAFGSQNVSPPPKPQQPQAQQNAQANPLSIMTIEQLYGKDGALDALVKGCVVIYKNLDNVILKQPHGRAVYAFNAPKELEVGGVYDIRVTKVENYNGLMEIKTIFDFKKTGTEEPSKLYLTNPSQDFKQPVYQNEVVSGVSGYYSRGSFKYGENLQIKLYFADKNLKPKGLTHIKLLKAHVGHFKEPQLIVYQKEDFEVLN